MSEMAAHEEQFAESYARLNAAQKKAVDTVEGPVLVIAGPGTGKTHILTLRIANILRQTQATPGSILVLTYTESAARTVRTRLMGLVGERAARDVFISTFHGFAEHILKEHPQSFPHTAGKRLAGDVESTLLWRHVLESEELTHLKTPKSPYFYLRDLSRLRDDLTRECITLDEYRAFAAEEAARIQADESLRYVRGEQKGAMKPEGTKKLERLEKIYEAARLIEAYEHLKDEQNVYDFTDVLRIVVDTIRADALLRALLQEQYQYILADEHQDANALQHALLDLLAYDEHPNIFVVGDEKQAIYRFQGADSTHFAAFLTSYPRTEIVALTDNYRSYQQVLDIAHTLIGRVPSSTGSHVALTAFRPGIASIGLLVAPDPLAEADQVASMVEQAIASGTLPHEIAVIAARNATANRFALQLAARGVPTLRAGDVSLSSRPLVRALLALMRAVADPLDMSALREALLAPWWDIELPARARLLRQSRDSELLGALTAQYPDVAGVVHTLQRAALAVSPVEVFSQILVESGARSYVLAHAEHLEDIPLIRGLMGHLEEVVVRHSALSYAQAIDALTKAHEHGLESVKSSSSVTEGKVTVITAHKAKGMEFEHVFVVGLTAREWEKGGISPTIPSPVDSRRSEEDLIRLFYVALTRAKNELVLSYAKATLEGKETPPSSLLPEGLPLIAVEYDPLPQLHTEVLAAPLIRELTHTYLTTDGLSPSALQEYLESPATFFAKRVLRLKGPETPALTIGTAVHAGIAAYLTTGQEVQAEAALALSLRRSLLPRTAVYERVSTHARESLRRFLTTPISLSGVPTEAVEKSYATTRHVAGVEVLLKGQVDAVFRTSSGECVVDFKTSSDVKIKDEKYAHQLAFYDLLLRAHGHDLRSARIVQVGPEKVEEYPVELTEETRAALLTTLDRVVEELLSGIWREGAASEYDDLLKLFQ